MTALIEQVVAAFNKPGAFTARSVEDDTAVEIQRADDGKYLTTVWLPGTRGNWGWQPKGRSYRSLPRATTVEEVVRAVATSILDEGTNR